MNNFTPVSHDNSGSVGNLISQPSTSSRRSTQRNPDLSDSLPNIGSHDCEPDGRHCDKQRDPPGQLSVYILPGDTERESYRLSTYVKFPSEAPVDACILANHGFTYTGYKDRVKCFSCGASISDWCVQDDPRLAKWHYRGCELVLGTGTRNVPIIRGRRIEFVGTFDSSLPNGDSGYASTSSYASSSTSSALDQPSHSKSSFSCNVKPQVQPSPVAVADTTVDVLAPGVVKVANAANDYQADQPNLVVHNISASASLRPAINKVQGLNLASVSSPKHKHLLLYSLDLHKEEDRVKSFASWPSKEVSISALAKSGFFYLGNHDRVQCFSCSGILRNWRMGDDVDLEHRSIIPDCKMVKKQEYRNVPLQEATVESNHLDLVEPPDPSPEEKRILEREFPCLHPVNPHMRNFDSRLLTFDQRWPSDKILAAKDHIARAGFFYLGERDRAKCWYCNGGLQNWDPKDEPFTEHAKWFPGCEFMLRCKGIDFVKRIVAQFPNLRRPTLKNARLDHRNGQLVASCPDQLTQTTIVDPRATTVTAGDILMGFSPSTSTGPTSTRSSLTNGRNTPPQTSTSNIEERVVQMGFERETVQRVLRKLRDEGRSTDSVQELVDALFNDDPMEDEVSSITSSNNSETMMQGIAHAAPNEIRVMNNASPAVVNGNTQMEVDRNQNSSDQPSNGSVSSKSSETSRESTLSKELADLEYERRCKTCHQKEADTVIIPCGHLSLCSQCSSTAKRCGLCGMKVQSVIKVFLA